MDAGIAHSAAAVGHRDNRRGYAGGRNSGFTQAQGRVANRLGGGGHRSNTLKGGTVAFGLGDIGLGCELPGCVIHPQVVLKLVLRQPSESLLAVG
ncbi:hypothetical protein D0544_04595 [Aestuariirhabdus litorea]|uniref:Uncharacterized protein n=1 Tax=Aestuariirhabdus litorea TaxID=2528527 RepID=A0A3P3VNR1_9GAMM|nr:hypothetical protein D0544_04595 [Aestuariirhabdus litorea]